MEIVNRKGNTDKLVVETEEKNIKVNNIIVAIYNGILSKAGSGTQQHIIDRQGQPIVFTRRKTAQLFSLLLELGGQDATADELCEHLWEHKAGLIYKNRQYLYSLVSDLSIALKEHDASEALIKTANGYALDMAQIEISK